MTQALVWNVGTWLHFRSSTLQRKIVFPLRQSNFVLMKLIKNTSVSANFIGSSKFISIIYLIWVFVSYSVFHALAYSNDININSSVINYLMILGFILLGSFLSSIFMCHVDGFLKSNQSLILLWLLITFLFFTGLHLFFKFAGNKGVLLPCIATANLLVFACIIGNWMIAVVKRPAEIIPLGVVAAFADLFSIFSGPTKHMAEDISTYYLRGMEGTPPFVDSLLIKIPILGADTLVPLFGVSDWIIVVFLTAAANKFDLKNEIVNEKKIKIEFLFFPIASAGLFLAIVFARVLSVPVPALPFVVIFYLSLMTIRYPEMRKLTKKELIPTILFSAVMLLLMCVM